MKTIATSLLLAVLAMILSAGGCQDLEVECLTGQDCSDNNRCTQDTCIAGECVNVWFTCDDNDICTMDTCKQWIGCVHRILPNCDTTFTCND